jgi:TATA-binding protein-associated factor
LLKRRENERQFLTQLLDGSKVEQYDLPVTINGKLRKYQQDGVNWLAFLAKYQLHGILCDGMFDCLFFGSQRLLLRGFI